MLNHKEYKEVGGGGVSRLAGAQPHEMATIRAAFWNVSERPMAADAAPVHLQRSMDFV